ncbi:hypothetical protein [Bacteroides acidifaciens]|nr:hypothetical protein [Bacteroides acidifaciens]
MERLSGMFPSALTRGRHGNNFIYHLTVTLPSLPEGVCPILSYRIQPIA